MKLLPFLLVLLFGGCTVSSTKDPATGVTSTTTAVNFSTQDFKNVVRLLNQTRGGWSFPTWEEEMHRMYLETPP